VREVRYTHRVLVERLEGKIPLGGPRRRWEDNTKVDLKEIGLEGVGWGCLTQNRDRWWAVVNTVLNLQAS
jgi:hypothetical protein